MSSQFADEFGRLSRLLDQGLTALRDQAREWAESENEYRKSVGVGWVEVIAALPDGTVSQRDAWVKARTANQRLRRDLADGLRTAALEAVRSRRTQISALQTLMNAHAEEARFVRTGPES